MGKKKFIELLTLAAQPLPSKAGKLTRSGDYTDKQILRHTNEASKAKLRDKSRPKTASTGQKSPRRGSS